MSGTRLQALQSAFAGFGGAFASINTMIRAANEVETIEARVDHQIAMNGIQRENEQVDNRAAADALSGATPADDMTDNARYRRVRATILGQRQGLELGDRWRREVHDRTPIGGDLRRATDEWMRSSVGRGSGDAIFDRHMLATLNTVVERGMNTRRDEGARAVIEQGEQEHRALIGQRVASGSFSAQDIAEWTDQAAVIYRGDRNRATAFVTQAMEGAVRTGDVAGAQRFLTALQQPGSGRDGQSWHDDNPQAFNALEARLVERVRHTREVAGAAAYNQIEDRIRSARSPSDIASIQEEIASVHSQYGGVEDRQRAEQALATRAAPLFRQQEAVNRLGEWSVGAGSPDPSVVRQNIDAFLGQVPQDPQNPNGGRGISMLSTPERVGTLVARLGAISDTMGAQLRTALADTANPEGQAAAIRFLRTVEGARGGSSDFALSLVPEEHRGSYRVISDMLTTTGAPVERIVERIGALGGNDAERTLREATWQRLYPNAGGQQQAETRMRREITKGLREHLGESGSILPGSNYAVAVDPALQDALEQNARQAAVFAQQIGADVDGAVRGSVRDLQQRTDLMPMADGSVRAVLRRDGVGQDGQASPTYSDGAPRVRGGIAVRNPGTGTTENTLATAQRDLALGQRIFSGMFAEGGSMALADDPRLAAMGLRPVVHSGNSRHAPGGIVFQSGEEATLGDQRVRLPSDPREAERILIEHFQRIENPRSAGTAGDAGRLLTPTAQAGRDADTAVPGRVTGINGAETRFRIVPETSVVNGQPVTLYRLAYRFGFRERQITAEERAATPR